MQKNFIAFLDESEQMLNQKKLGLEMYAEPPLPSGKFQTDFSFFNFHPSLINFEHLVSFRIYRS